MTPPRAERNSALDFTKGALILLMVLYHWGIFFLGPVPYFYDFLRFLTPSFIFITGTILALILAPKYGWSAGRMISRMGVRGFKLLALFTLLNLAIEALFPVRGRSNFSFLPSFSQDLYAIYVSGNSNSDAFRVLLPISYLLLLSGVLLMLLRRSARLFLLLQAILCLGIAVAEFQGWVSVNLTLVGFGMLGMAVSCAGQARLDRAASLLVPLLIVYAIYAVLMVCFGPIYLVQLLGVPLTCLVLYGIGRALGESTALARLLVFLGQYSLLAYIGQIGLLQAMRLAAKRAGAGEWVVWAALPIAAVLTVLLVYGAAWLRRRSSATDRAYRFVFA